MRRVPDRKRAICNSLLYLLKAFLEVVWGHHRWGFFAGLAILLLLVVNSPSGQMLAKPRMDVPKAIVDLVADQERIKSRVTRAAFAFLHKP